MAFLILLDHQSLKWAIQLFLTLIFLQLFFQKNFLLHLNLFFYGYSHLEKIVINTPINSIPDFCFFECISLKSVTLCGFELLANSTIQFDGSSINSIGESAFSEVPISYVYVSKSISYLSRTAFAFINTMISMNVQLPFQEYFNLSIQGMTNLASFILENISIISNSILDLADLNITTLDDSAYSQVGIIEATLPKVCQKVGSALFASCDKLVKVTIPFECTSIEDSFLDSCLVLDTLIINDHNVLFNHIIDFSGTNINKIGYYAFFRIDSIQQIVFSGPNYFLDSHAFGGLNYLSVIEFTSLLTNFSSDHPFFSCNNIQCIQFSGISCSSFNQFNFQDFFSNTNLENQSSWCNSTCPESSSEEPSEESDFNWTSRFMIIIYIIFSFGLILLISILVFLNKK